MTDETRADLYHLERQLSRLRDQLAILAGGRPTPEQLAGEITADKDVARRIHQARPGIPVHHILATLEAFRAVLEMEPAETWPVDPETAERVRAGIESELYAHRERTGFWPEGDVTGEIARLATRGALEALGHTDSREQR